jgi:hypothetical protein
MLNYGMLHSWTAGEQVPWEKLQTGRLLVTDMAHTMRLELKRACVGTSLLQARDQLGLWSCWVQAAVMAEQHLKGRIGHWRQGLNDLFQLSSTRQDYRFTEYQTAMFYFVAGKLEIL